jgi:hypothetical protein
MGESGMGDNRVAIFTAFYTHAMILTGLGCTVEAWGFQPHEKPRKEEGL